MPGVRMFIETYCGSASQLADWEPAAPDAVDNVKRLLKGIFKRGKKQKQDKANETSTSTQSTNDTANSKPSTADANGKAAAVDKPLPPTHPLNTGPHEKPQEAVPQNHEARPGPVAVPQEAQKKLESQDIASTTNTTSSQAAPVAVAAKDEPPIPPPKSDAAAETSAPANTAGTSQ